MTVALLELEDRGCQSDQNVTFNSAMFFNNKL